MTRNLWGLALAAIMFLAGMATQHLIWGPGPVQAAPYEPLVQRYTEEFQLEPARTRALRKLLSYYYEEEQAARDHYVSALNTRLGQELDAVAAKYRAFIRDKVLPPDQRERFDRMLAEASLDLPPR